MSDALHRLLEVQEEDTLLDQLRHRRRSHPLRAELDELDRRAAELESARAEAAAQVEVLAERQRRIEADVEATGQRAQSIEARMYSGEVSAGRDLQALSEESQSLKRRINHLEDEELTVMEEREPLDRRLAELDSAVGAAAERRAALEAELAEAQKDLLTQESEHEAARRTRAASVPADLLERYEKLRARLGGVAVAPLAHGTCGGCHLSLPATELDRMKRAPADAIVSCEQCGRMLVRPTA
jgi:predicted  nucleic acid-binding Zn-ribbon protein